MPKMSLVEARALLGWSQQRLADESGVRQTTIGQYETGITKQPSFSNAIRITRALQRGGLAGLSAEDLFFSENDKVA